MVFNVIWTFTKCNKDWVQYSMIARTQDIPSTAFIPTDAIPIIHYGVDPESTTPIGIYVYKTDLGEVKEFLGLASLSEGDLIEDWQVSSALVRSALMKTSGGHGLSFPECWRVAGTTRLPSMPRV